MKKVLALGICLIPFIAACSSGKSSSAPDESKATSNEGDSGPLSVLSWDDSNCGATGYACLNGRTCQDDAGICVPAWQYMSDAGALEFGAAGSALNNQFVVSGGCDTFTVGVDALTQVVIYDPPTDTWSTGPSLNTGRFAHSAVSTDDETYVVSGLSSCQEGSSEGPGGEVLYVSGQSWGAINNSGFTGGYNVAAAWTGTGIFVFSGSGGYDFNTTQAVLLQLGTGWQNIDCPLPGCGAVGAITFPDGPFVRVMSSSGTSWLYDLEANVWSSWTVPSGGPSSYDGHFGDDGQRIYYLDGMGNVDIYDRASSSWTTDSSTQPTGLCTNGATAWVNGELFVWSGSCVSDVLSDVGGRYQPPAP